MQKKLKFTKMHALGNDFMVINHDDIDDIDEIDEMHFLERYIPQWSSRHRGIGFDQFLIIQKSLVKNTFFYRIFNADGTEVGQCGNGARCAARYVHEQGLCDEKKIILMTKTTQMSVTLEDDAYQRITVELNPPQFADDILIQHHIFHRVNVGNPHAVTLVPLSKLASMDMDTNIEKIGTILNSGHPLFVEGTNVEWMYLNSLNHMTLRVFERGVGETQACGSGACAAMVCARKFHGAAASMDIELPGGSLYISWEGDQQPLFMTGNAIHVFDGEIEVV